MTTDQIDVGDKVKHPKFGQGTVMTKTGGGDSLKVTVKFSPEVGEKRLVAKFAKLKKIEERPTLTQEAAAGSNNGAEGAEGAEATEAGGKAKE